ncbi:TetR/AcrR family transcriptional regulator [Amycolatopsis sp. cmx-8-4]|uniref:TetR/AcrR family transcriptional regulator n=1 Tax=Amycolatopsis sp. cmx-8-4 TaxID=2790947 RepID=UPI003978D9A7
MDEADRAPTGLGRRRSRRSDEETAERMLEAAMAMVGRTGLTVSLDHLRFEDIIREAGVARSAVYRRWPYKDLFFGELVTELAKAAVPTAADTDAIIGLIKNVVSAHRDGLGTAEGRHALLVELFRQAALQDFQALYGSAEWRTYLALHATFLSLAEGELRQQIQEILARSEHGFTTRVAAAWQHIAGLFGYRLRPELGSTFETVAILVSATARGLILIALSTPDLADERIPARPFGAAATEDWSLPALGIAGTAVAFLEPDPGISWDDDRIEAVQTAVNSLTVPSP